MIATTPWQTSWTRGEEHHPCCGEIHRGVFLGTCTCIFTLALNVPVFTSVPCREKTLRNISLTYQQFQNSNENLMFWMNNLPKHQVKTTDGPSQINYKLQAQKVCSRASTSTCNVTRTGGVCFSEWHGKW